MTQPHRTPRRQRRRLSSEPPPELRPREPSDEASPTPSVSVIIPVYNDRDRLLDCLRSLARQTYPADAVEIIVVDNGSVEPIRLPADLAHVRLFEEHSPGSYAARNTGILASAGDILAFTDSDCTAAPEWIASGMRALAQTYASGVAAGEIAFTFAKRPPGAVALYDSLTFMQQARLVRQFGFGVTANLFVERAVFDDVGLFNADLLSGGDREWGQRAHQAGFAPVFAPTAVVYHPARARLADLTRKVRRIAAGELALSAQRTSLFRRLRIVARRFFPPISQSKIVWADGRIFRLSDRIGVTLVTWGLHYVKALELLRVALAGKARRS